MNIKDILPAVAVAVFNENGEILLQKRKNRNQWGLISGHVEFGENVERAAIRELWEETGLKAKILRIIGVYSEPATQTYEYPTGRVVHCVTTFFLAELIKLFRKTFPMKKHKN